MRGMGLGGDANLPDESPGSAAAAIACSICLDAVTGGGGGGGRSTARLQCGHEFHLGYLQLISVLTPQDHSPFLGIPYMAILTPGCKPASLMLALTALGSSRHTSSSEVTAESCLSKRLTHSCCSYHTILHREYLVSDITRCAECLCLGLWDDILNKEYCIGSAFNAKGVMQCPNCRKVEKGNWLYANGSSSLSDLNMHEWTPDEDLYELNYSEMPFGVHWCPFGRLARVTSSFEEGESSPALSFHDITGRHAIYTDHPPTSSTAHPCPYTSYMQPLHLSSTSSSHIFSESLVDGSTYQHNWSQVPGPADVHNAHALPTTDGHYNIWEYQSPAFFTQGNRANSGDQASVSSATNRPPRLDSDGLSRAGSLAHPFMGRHRSRASGSLPSSFVRPYLSSSGAQAHVHEHSQGNHGTAFAGVRQSGGSRGFASIGPTSLSPPDHTGFYYLFPPTQASNQSLQDVESSEGNRFYAWERDRLAPFPMLRVDRESGWWGPIPQSTPSLDSTRVGFWDHNGAERPSSEGRSEGSTYRPSNHGSRMRPFN